MIHVLDLLKTEFAELLKQRKLPAFRANQILDWLYVKRADAFNQMTNLSKTMQADLANEFALYQSTVEDTLYCSDGTIKLLLKWPDGALTETVLMTSGKRRTVCISSQVGCPVKCAFCASGLKGLQRSLSAGEMVEQVMRSRMELPEGERISNVVVMGMGEPFANYEQVLKAVRILNASWALEIGARHITVSTIGLPDMIRKFAEEDLQITLAVSLHAPDDELRSELIPWAQKISISELFKAIDFYYEVTHREVTLEYVLLEGVNTDLKQADKLARWAQKTRCNVNLINYNTVEETGFKSAKKQTVQAFMDRLEERGVNVHLRKSYGGEIDAACGQLRYNRETNTD